MTVPEYIDTLTVAGLNGLVEEHKIELPAGCKKKVDIAAAVCDWLNDHPGAIVGHDEPVAPPDPVQRKSVLDGLVLSQAGKPIEGEPTRDNYAVRAAKGVTIQKPSATIAALRAAYPGCVFTFFAK